MSRLSAAPRERCQAPLRAIVAVLKRPNDPTIWGTDYALDCGHIVNNDGRTAKAHKRCWKCLHRYPVDVGAQS